MVYNSFWSGNNLYLDFIRPIFLKEIQQTYYRGLELGHWHWPSNIMVSFTAALLRTFPLIGDLQISVYIKKSLQKCRFNTEKSTQDSLRPSTFWRANLNYLSTTVLQMLLVHADMF